MSTEFLYYTSLLPTRTLINLPHLILHDIGEQHIDSIFIVCTDINTRMHENMTTSNVVLAPIKSSSFVTDLGGV